MPTVSARLLPLAASALLLAGCPKPAEQKAPANKPAPQAEPFSTDATVSPTTTPGIAGIPAAAIAAAERAKARVEVASTATRDNGAIYKEAKALFAEQKYSEALHALDGIQAELMTPPQEKAVNELRAQIQAAQNPGSAVAAAPATAGTPAGAVAAAARAATTTSSGAPVDNRALYLQAKSLFAEKKYTEALQTLDAMQTSTLNEAQQKAVAELRSKITAAGL